jgi:hypothetical protein
MQHQKIAIVLKIPQPFTCEFELGFSSMHQINTNHRSKIQNGPTISVPSL